MVVVGSVRLVVVPMVAVHLAVVHSVVGRTDPAVWRSISREKDRLESWVLHAWWFTVESRDSPPAPCRRRAPSEDPGSSSGLDASFQLCFQSKTVDPSHRALRIYGLFAFGRPCVSNCYRQIAGGINSKLSF